MWTNEIDDYIIWKRKKSINSSIKQWYKRILKDDWSQNYTKKLTDSRIWGLRESSHRGEFKFRKNIYGRWKHQLKMSRWFIKNKIGFGWSK